MNLTNGHSEKDLSWKKIGEASRHECLSDMVYVDNKREMSIDAPFFRERWKFFDIMSVEEEDLVPMRTVSMRNRDSLSVCQ